VTTSPSSNAHSIHHYVPSFLLKNWHGGSEGKLTQFQWLPTGTLEAKHYKSGAVAKEPHLYSTINGDGSLDTSIEKEFFTDVIDDKAAPILIKLHDNNIDSLTKEERDTWARFLIAQIVRLPSNVDGYERSAKNELLEGALAMATEQKRPELFKYLVENTANAGKNIAREILSTTIESEKILPLVLNASWHVFSTGQAEHKLLIGDSPMLKQGSLQDSFLWILPISPTLFFCATNQSQLLQIVDIQTRESARKVVEILNLTTITKAEKYVYGTDSTHESIIKQHLKKLSVVSD
jgi:hypothetical protein